MYEDSCVLDGNVFGAILFEEARCDERLSWVSEVDLRK